MEPWIPLLVAIVGAITAGSVAFWNSRGESGELRQLKSMNEVIPNLDASSNEAIAFIDARDALLVRVAARTLTAPARRVSAGWIALLVVIVGGAILALFLVYPLLDDVQSKWLNVVASAIAGGVGAVAGISTIRKSQHIAASRSKRDETLRSLMASINSEDKQ